MKKTTTLVGHNTVEIIAIDELNQVINDPEEVLAFNRNVEEDSIIIVTS